MTQPYAFPPDPSNPPPPPPYPNYGAGGSPDAWVAPYLAPAKRAGLLLIVLGALGLLAGTCFFGVSFALPTMNLPTEQAAELQRMEERTGVPMTRLFLIAAGLAAIPAVALLVLGLFVRRGGAGAAVTAIVVVSLLIVLMLVQLLGALAGNPNPLAGACFAAIPLALLGLQLAWLIQALRAAGPLAAARLHFGHQASQMRQTQAVYSAPSPWPMQPPPPPPPTA